MMTVIRYDGSDGSTPCLIRAVTDGRNGLPLDDSRNGLECSLSLQYFDDTYIPAPSAFCLFSQSCTAPSYDEAPSNVHSYTRPDIRAVQ